MANGPKPVKFRSGNIEVNVWTNMRKDEKGTEYEDMSITVQKKYFASDTKTWEESHNYFPNEILILAHLCGQAYEYIRQQKTIVPSAK